MLNKNPYQVLGVNSHASLAEIKKAYRRLARQYHPDVNSGNKAAEERFKEISAAFEILADPQKRALYDEFGEEALRLGFDPEKARAYRDWQKNSANFGGFRGGRTPGGFQWGGPMGGGASGDLGDLFGNIFGEMFTGGPQARSGRHAYTSSAYPEPPVELKGRDIHTELHLSFLEAILGKEKEIILRHGSTSKLKVKIPPGIHEGQKIRLAHKGEPSLHGGEPGDLLLTVHITPHPFLRREGHDLYVEMPITIKEAWSGGKIMVPTPHGKIQVTLPPHAQSGLKLRLKGKGISDKKQIGDLYIVLMINLPAASAKEDEIKSAIERLESLYSGEKLREELNKAF